MINVNNITIHAGDFTLSDISFEIQSGECMALMGKSGSGKTTIMEAICGLREVSQGTIHIDGENRTYAAPKDKMIGLVPQDNILFTTMTVREHLAYGPRLRKWKKADIKSRVEELAHSLRISNLLERKTHGLSGGEAKRVGIGRAIAAKPSLLCLDESFTGLDEEALSEVASVVKSTIQQEKICTLLITHKRAEAKFMGDVIYEVTVNGLVEKIASQPEC